MLQDLPAFELRGLFGGPAGVSMNEPAYPRSRHDSASDAEELERLEAAMDAVPSGAVVISGTAVGLLLLCWLAVYVFVFLPRGTVG